MDNLTFFLIIIIIVIIFYLPKTYIINEKYSTLGSNINIGNNMDFIQQNNKNITALDKSLSKSLVPDFEPNNLNINPDLNSYGYTTNNKDADLYYKQRGFMNPINANEYTNSIQYMLSHPYQTRYCDK